jgi:hypothetical protein
MTVFNNRTETGYRGYMIGDRDLVNIVGVLHVESLRRGKNTLQTRSDLCIPRNGAARPRSQFIFSHFYK